MHMYEAYRAESLTDWEWFQESSWVVQNVTGCWQWHQICFGNRSENLRSFACRWEAAYVRWFSSFTYLDTQAS